MPRARAFGIDIDAETPLAALAASDRREGEVTRIVLAGSVSELDRDWPAGEATCLEDARAAGGVAIHSHPEAGYRIEEDSAGAYRVSRDGLEVTCGFDDLGPWDRERFLTSRVLPVAATLRGQELLHAGCVGIDGQALAFLGASHAGKSSLTLQLVLRGASLLTDDLLAIELRDGAPYAHAGLALAGVRYAERDLLSASDLDRLRPVHDRDGKVWVSPQLAPEPLPLAAVYVLVRDPAARELRFETDTAPDPRELLASSFFARLRFDDQRVARQLFVWAAISTSVPLVRIVIPADVGAAALADRIAGGDAAPLGRARAA